MANLSGIVKQLRKERDHVERQLSGLNAAISAFVALYGGSQTETPKPQAVREVPSEDRSRTESDLTDLLYQVE